MALALAPAAGCAPAGSTAFSTSVGALSRVDPSGLTPEEAAEARRLAAMSPALRNPLRAAWDWDWRSELSGVKDTRVAWFEEGAAYRRALAAVEGRAPTGPERVRAAEAARDAAQRGIPLAREAARRAHADLEALRAAFAAAEAARAAPVAPGATRPEAMAPAAVAAARAAPEARGALVAAMAAAARADAEAIANAGADLGVYGGPAISRLRALAGEIGVAAAELDDLAFWFRGALAGAPGGRTPGASGDRATGPGA